MNEITNNIFNVPAKLEPVETATILGKEFVIYGTVQEPWFKAKDVAEWIEMDSSHASRLVNSVDEDEKARRNMATQLSSLFLYILLDKYMFINYTFLR